jgi:hypothetical protein
MRSPDQSRVIVQDQQNSGLDIFTFSQQQQISTTTFYSSRNKLGLSSSQFVRAKVTKQIEVIEERPAIVVTVGKANVNLPDTTSATYLGQLLREFA